ELWKQFQCVVSQDLLADSQGMLFEQVAAVHFLREYFGQATARKLGGAVDAFGMIAIRAPHDPIGWHHFQPFVKGALGHAVTQDRQPDRVDPDVAAMPHNYHARLADPGKAPVKKDELGAWV